MKALKFLIRLKPEEKKEGKGVSSERLRGRDRNLYKALAFHGLVPGPPSEKISLEEAKETLGKYEEETRGHEQGGRSQEAARCRHQAEVWCLILAKRALFKGDQELLEECRQKYETLTGKKFLEKEEVGRAIKLVEECFPRAG